MTESIKNETRITWQRRFGWAWKESRNNVRDRLVSGAAVLASILGSQANDAKLAWFTPREIVKSIIVGVIPILVGFVWNFGVAKSEIRKQDDARRAVEAKERAAQEERELKEAREQADRQAREEKERAEEERRQTAAEITRRGAVIAQLRNEYITEGMMAGGVPMRIATGVDHPPLEWYNARLRARGEPWRVEFRGLDLMSVPISE